MTPVLPVTTEFAASLCSGERRVMILPFTLLRSTMLSEREIVVLEPFHGSDAPVYAADYTAAYGWRSAQDMPLEFSRMSLTINRVRLVYCRDLTERDFLADGVWSTAGGWAWQRRASVPALHATTEDAWMASQRAAWGRRDSGDRATKSLVVNISVNMTAVGRRQA